MTFIAKLNECLATLEKPKKSINLLEELRRLEATSFEVPEKLTPKQEVFLAHFKEWSASEFSSCRRWLEKGAGSKVITEYTSELPLSDRLVYNYIKDKYGFADIVRVDDVSKALGVARLTIYNAIKSINNYLERTEVKTKMRR